MLVPVAVFRSASGAPIIDRAAIVECVRTEFGVTLSSISQVSGGQDSDAIVCRATTEDGMAVAVKASRSARVTGLLVSAAFAAQGWPGIVAPLLTPAGQPFTVFQASTLSVTPWIAGREAYEAGMSVEQWREFGRLLSRIHGAQMPPQIRDHLDVERYRTPAAEVARTLDNRIRAAQARSGPDSTDPAADALIDEWWAARESIALILDHIDELGDELRAAPASGGVSHGDAHTGNLLLDDNGEMWLLDWDEVAFAPRERDLMFVIGGVLSDAPVTPREQKWFFEGYGPAEIDRRRLAYYQCSWAAQDLADFATRILEKPGPSASSAQALRFIRGILSPTGIVELARSSLEGGRGLSPTGSGS